jgi:uncharacterized RDD family membrane protein YckC
MTDQAPPPAPEPSAPLTPEPPPAPATYAPPPAPAPAAPGTAGFAYADVPNRAIAYIIDAIIVGILVVIVGAVLASIGLATGNFVGVAVWSIVGLLIGAGYFIYTWTARRATIGMGILGMQVGNAGDGKTMTTEQAVRRWLAISAPSIVAQAFQGIAVVGWVLWLAAFAWFIFLLWTTYQSPTKQGWHDHFANTMVVKAVRSVA